MGYNILKLNRTSKFIYLSTSLYKMSLIIFLSVVEEAMGLEMCPIYLTFFSLLSRKERSKNDCCESRCSKTLFIKNRCTNLESKKKMPRQEYKLSKSRSLPSSSSGPAWSKEIVFPVSVLIPRAASYFPHGSHFSLTS